MLGRRAGRGSSTTKRLVAGIVAVGLFAGLVWLCAGPRNQPVETSRVRIVDVPQSGPEAVGQGDSTSTDPPPEAAERAQAWLMGAKEIEDRCFYGFDYRLG